MSITTASLLPDPPARRHDEEDLCKAIAKYLHLVMPPDAWWTHLPMGGQRHDRAGRTLAAMGAQAGSPDYLVVWDGRALFFEVKAAGGYLSAVQRQTIRKIGFAKAPVDVCRSQEDVYDFLTEHGVPLRGSRPVAA